MENIGDDCGDVVKAAAEPVDKDGFARGKTALDLAEHKQESGSSLWPTPPITNSNIST